MPTGSVLFWGYIFTLLVVSHTYAYKGCIGKVCRNLIHAIEAARNQFVALAYGEWKELSFHAMEGESS
jgi:hypothetical protein